VYGSCSGAEFYTAEYRSRKEDNIMNIRAKLSAFAIVIIAVLILNGCYSWGPVTQDPVSKPKPSTQQGSTPTPDPTLMPAPEPEPTPEPTATPET